MKSKWLIGTLGAVLALAYFAETASAQRWRGGGGTSYGFGIGPGGVSAYYGRGGGYGGYGYGGYGGYPGYGGYGGYYGRGYGSPYYGGYYSDYGYPSYGYYNSPNYTSESYPSYAQSNVVPSQSFYSGPTPEPNKVLVHIRVPDPEATVWIENTATDQRGFDRVFLSPELESGKQYVYTVKAKWMENNGQERTQEKKVNVQPGRQAIVAFGGETGNPGATPAPLPNRNIQPRGTESRSNALPSDSAFDATAETSASARTHTGKLIEATKDEIVMTGLQGETRHTHRLAENAEILIHGKKADAKDLKAGDQVRVTTKEGDKHMATKIEVIGGATSPKDNREDSEHLLPK